MRNTPAVSVTQGQYSLLAIVNGAVATHMLPEHGEVSIGRARENDIQIVDPSVSRHHAVIRIGPPLTIADAESANGTQIKGHALAPGKHVEIPLGEVIDLGSTMVMVQHRPVATREWRIWQHGYFEGRLEDECARSTRTTTQFGLVRIQCGQLNSSAVVQEVLANALRSDDVVGIYGPGEYEVLLVERTTAEAERIVAGLSRALRDAGAPCGIGLACFPADGRAAHTLAEKAGSAARGAKPGPSASVVVKSPAMIKLFDLVQRVANSDISILILGETGVGKEVLAEAIHRYSPRKDKPCLRLNCAALTETLLESELFGHERGSFTGASQAKQGLLETAQGGTIMLDEIGDLPMSVQVKLLRVIEERQVWRVGSVRSRAIDVRFLAATNRDLEADIVSGRFRQDLFFRLNGMTLHIPPLRERTEEIEDLARGFLAESCRHHNLPRPDLSDEALDRLMHYSWPGNIRELRNVVERAVVLASEGIIRPEHLPVEKMTATVSTRITPSTPPAPVTGETTASSTLMPGPPDSPLPPPFGDYATGQPVSLADRLRRDVQEVERQHIIDALSRCGGNQTRAAQELGVSRRTLISRLEAYGIPRPLKDRRP